MDDPVTVAIPVGPSEANKRWLREAVESVRNQSYRVDDILLIDDMADLEEDYGCRVWRSPWRLGVAHAFNFGVALAKHELVFLLGSDDWLEPDCIRRCVNDYVKLGRPGDTYLFVGVIYSDDQDDQFIPCNAAMVTKSLWARSGGFPIEASSGAPDAALISIMMRNREAGQYVGVSKNKPLYNYRVHPETDTAGRAPWQSVVLETRNLVTQFWSRPDWSRRKEDDVPSSRLSGIT